MNGILPDNAAKQARENRSKNKNKRRGPDTKTVNELRKAVQKVDDPDAQRALELLYQMQTGETLDNGQP